MARRSSFALPFVLLAAMLVASPVAAGRQWCRGDPAFTVGGKTVSVDVVVLDTTQKSVTGPIAIKLTVPNGVDAQLISQDAGFNGYGETVSIVYSSSLRKTSKSTPIRVEAKVPSKTIISVTMNVTAGGRTLSINGRSSSTMSLSSTVPA
jgi:hypothetical protein